MRIIPILIFGFYIYCEVSFFVLMANGIGVFLALIAMVITSLIGLSLVRSQGFKNLILMQQKMINHEDPANEMVKGASLFIAGFFLLIPGFLTDIIGAIFLLPPMQHIVSRFIAPRAHIYASFGYRRSSQKKTSSADEIIEGEFKQKDD